MIKTKLNPHLEIEGYLLTMFDTRLALHQVAAEMQKFFKDKVYPVKIMRNVKIGESPSFGKPVVLYDPFSIGAKNYTELANEFLRRNGKENMQKFDNILTYDAPNFEVVSKPENTENNIPDSNINKFIGVMSKDKPKGGLGKGLDVLFGANSMDIAEETASNVTELNPKVEESVLFISLSQIVANPFQPRQNFD